jgi:WD40 repeat protein
VRVGVEIVGLGMMEYNIILESMKVSLQLVLALLLLVQLGTPWCLKTTVNLTSAVTKVAYSPDNTMIAVTSTSANNVVVYDTTNFFALFTFTPSANNVKVARWSKDGLWLGVGHDNGRIDLVPGAAPFSNTPTYSFSPNVNKVISDLDFNWNNNKMLVCYSNDNNFFVVDNYANNGSRAYRSKGIGQKSLAGRWSKNDDAVVIDDNRNALVFPIPASPTGIPGQSAKATTPLTDFTDVAVRPTTTTPIKIVASGGGTGQKQSSYFFNSGATPALTNNAPTTNPAGVVRTACYGGDALNYAVGGDDKKLWIYAEASNSESQVMAEGVNNLLSCQFSNDGENIAVGTDLTSGAAYVLIYARTCFFCAPGFYKTGLASCSSCSSAMTSCSMCLNGTYCYSCFQGYYLNVSSGPSICISCASQQ